MNMSVKTVVAVRQRIVAVVGLALVAGWGAVGSAQVVTASADAGSPASVRIMSGTARQARGAAPESRAARRVTLELRDVTLRDALRAIADSSGVPLFYSTYVVPVERRVSVTFVGVPVEEALRAVLRGTGVEPRATPDGGIMLERARAKSGAREERARVAPSITGRVRDARTMAGIANVTVSLEGSARSATTAEDGSYLLAGVAEGVHLVTARRIGYAKGVREVTIAGDSATVVDFALEPTASTLDQVVVTGTIVPTEVRALPTPISVVSGEELRARGLERVDQIFRGMVPGAISFDRPTADYYSTFTLRGANSFLGNTVKTYVDGVEVAEAAFIATIDPNSIERIEVLRGPQGSTVHGSDAGGGVIQIFTKRGKTGLSRPEFDATLLSGAVGRTGDGGSATRHHHSLTMSGGGDAFTYNVGGSFVSIGDWTPSYDSKTSSLFGGTQLSHGRLTIDLSGRYARKQFDWPMIVSLRDAGYGPYLTPPSEVDDLRQEMVGARLTYEAMSRWRHNLTIGYDNSYYSYYYERARETTPADTFLIVYTSHSEKGSLAYNNSLELPAAGGLSSTLTTGLDLYDLNVVSFYTGNATRNFGTIDGTVSAVRSPGANLGVFGQLQAGFRETVFLTAGVRAERNDNFGDDYGTAISPRVGLSIVGDMGPVSIKPRVAYGEGIRAPLAVHKYGSKTSSSERLANPELGPEQQRGWDAGLELLVGRRAALGVTRFDQRALGLIQIVRLNPGETPTRNQFQNVGEIRNVGWELEARATFGLLDASATYAIYGSTVEKLSPTYTGDLQVGDHVLGVPKRSGGASFTVRPLARTSLTTDVIYVGDWTEIDMVALMGASYGGEPYRGSRRAYWMTYPGFVKTNLSLSHALSERLTALLRVENVADDRSYEQYNINTPMGRSVMAGARMVF